MTDRRSAARPPRPLMAPARQANAEPMQILASYAPEALEGDPELAAITRFAANLCEAPVAAITMTGEESERFLVHYGSDLREIPREIAFCPHVMAGLRTMEVPDAVADARAPVAAEVEQYLACDLVFYRAEAPEGLVARQAQAWDPVLEWARDALGARFMLAQGVMHVAQPREAVAAAARNIPSDGSDMKQIWQLAALSVITTLTGSALLALALNYRFLPIYER